MWRHVVRSRLQQQHNVRFLHASRAIWQENVIEIQNGSFYRQHPSSQDINGRNSVLFPELNFALASAPSGETEQQFWSVISPSSLARTIFLQILAGQHICMPPTARRYPYLANISTTPQHAIRYVGFDADRGTSVGGTNVRGAYLSARYESRQEETDFSLYNYLIGQTELNAIEQRFSDSDKKTLEELVDRLNLRKLLQMPVANLSNGQTRRARIAKALMARPEVLLLDGPFMGLDPNTAKTMESILYHLATNNGPRLIMSLRPEDGVPGWVNHLVIADESLRILSQGPKDLIFTSKERRSDSDVLETIVAAAKLGHNAAAKTRLSRDAFPLYSPTLEPGDAVVKMQGVKVAYGDKVVLGDWTQTADGVEKTGLWWELRRGQRCGIFGANGSGKTTMLSLITSDHPQTYSLPITLFGRSRLPGPGTPGISLFDIQRRMGHSSPEVHAFFPKQLTIRRALESAWADAPLSRPTLSEESNQRVDAVLRWFADELNPEKGAETVQRKLEKTYNLAPNASMDQRLASVREAYELIRRDGSDLAWSGSVRFGELRFSSQRLVLFLRAIVAQPELVILDEALSGIDEHTRDRALLFLSHGEGISAVNGDEATPSLLSQTGQIVFNGLSSEQALLVISHAKEDVPGCLREWICLPEPGEETAPRTGTLKGPLELNPGGWDEIWAKPS